MALTVFVGIAGSGALFLSWFFSELCRERRRSHGSAARIRLLWGRNATALHRHVHKIALPEPRKRVLVMRTSASTTSSGKRQVSKLTHPLRDF